MVTCRLSRLGLVVGGSFEVGFGGKWPLWWDCWVRFEIEVDGDGGIGTSGRGGR